MSEADRFRTLIGAYLTGLLDPEERADLEVHLRSCSACREEVALIAPLPAILRRLPAPVAGESALASAGTVAGAGSRPALGQAHLAVLARRAARRQRSARAALVGAAAALVVTVALVVALLIPGSSKPSGRVMALRGPVASGKAILQAKAWGTQIMVTAERLPKGEVLVAAVYGPAGETAAGSWSAPPGGHAVVEMATSWDSSSIRRLVVFQYGTGAVVLHS